MLEIKKLLCNSLVLSYTTYADVVCNPVLSVEDAFCLLVQKILCMPNS